MFKNTFEVLLVVAQRLLTVSALSKTVVFQNTENCTIFQLFDHETDHGEVSSPNSAMLIFRSGSFAKGSSFHITGYMFARQVCVVRLFHYGSRVIKKPTFDFDFLDTFDNNNKKSWLKEILASKSIGWYGSYLSSSQTYTFVFAARRDVIDFFKGKENSLADFTDMSDSLFLLFKTKPGSLTACTNILTYMYLYADKKVRCWTIHRLNIYTLRKLLYKPNQWIVDNELMNIQKSFRCGKTSLLKIQDAHDYALQDVIVCKTNSTIVNKWLFSSISTKVHIRFKEDEPILKTASYYTEFSSSVVFLSCYAKPKLSFYIYILPFGKYLWILILLSISTIFVTTVTAKYFRVFGSITQVLFYLVSTLFDDLSTVKRSFHESTTFRLSIAGWLLTVAILINLYSALISSEITVPTVKMRLENFSEIFCPTNQIKDYFHTEVHNHQLKKHLQFWFPEFSLEHKTYDEYDNRLNPNCFSLLSPADQNFNKYVDESLGSSQLMTSYSKDAIKRNYMHPLQYKILRVLSSAFKTHVDLYLDSNGFEDSEIFKMDTTSVYSFWKQIDSRARKPATPIPKPLKQLLKFLSYSTRFYPKVDETNRSIIKKFTSRQTAVEMELIKCQKSVFVGMEEDVKMEYQYLRHNYQRKDYYIVKDKFIRLQKIWIFEDYRTSKVPFYFNQLVSSGITGQLKIWINHRLLLQRMKGTKVLKDHLHLEDWIPSPLNLSMQSLFILYGILALSAVFSTFLEQIVALIKLYISLKYKRDMKSRKISWVLTKIKIYGKVFQ